jgi:hypothetical protein
MSLISLQRYVSAPYVSLYCLHCFQAWEMCRAGAFNLSYASLTSHKALKALHKLVMVDPAFWAEITQPCSQGTPLALTMQQVQSENLKEVAIDVHAGS